MEQVFRSPDEGYCRRASLVAVDLVAYDEDFDTIMTRKRRKPRGNVSQCRTRIIFEKKGNWLVGMMSRSPKHLHATSNPLRFISTSPDTPDSVLAGPPEMLNLFAIQHGLSPSIPSFFGFHGADELIPISNTSSQLPSTPFPSIISPSFLHATQNFSALLLAFYSSLLSPDHTSHHSI